MKNIIKTLLFLLPVFWVNSQLNAQCALHGCDPQLMSFGYNVNCVSQNSSTKLTLVWYIGGGDSTCTVPPGSWRIQISLPLNGIYGARNVSDITGEGFNWSYSDVDNVFNGINNVQMNYQASGIIMVNVEGLVVNTCAQVLTQANVYIQPNAFPFNGCSQAFANITGNDALSDDIGVQTALPVDLASFDARNGKCDEALIEWVTASERNSDFMELERSEDGNTYEPVYKVASLNLSSGGKYFFSDKNVNGGTKYLYRLRQVDFDGSTEYFKTISIEINHCSGGNVSLSILPNPAFDKVNISLNGISAHDRVKLVITNAIGEVVLTVPNASASTVNEIKLNGLTAGIYNVKLEGFDETSSKRFIKVD